MSFNTSAMTLAAEILEVGRSMVSVEITESNASSSLGIEPPVIYKNKQYKLLSTVIENNITVETSIKKLNVDISDNTIILDSRTVKVATNAETTIKLNLHIDGRNTN